MRYTLIGLASNLALYLVYLLITNLGMGHKTAMSLLYVAGVSLTFTFNKNWTFEHQGHVTKAFVKYVLIYALGYVVNLYMLSLLVDKFGYNHQFVQGVMVVLVALLLFMLQKTLVFSKAADLEK